MDVSFSNVLEGTRQYFMGVPKQAVEGSGQSVWPSGAPPPEEGTPAVSGVPAPSSRPPSAAAAPPSTPSSMSVPPRPPSEPLEPEPHIIHKATVMREAAEKRREQPEPEDEEEPVGALSPPSHIIRKPTPRTQPSPAPAPAAPCPSPARPPSNAPHPSTTPTEHQIEPPSQYRVPVHRVQTPTARPPDHFAPGRPPDPYSATRPPEQYQRYQYESNLPDSGRNSHATPIASPQPSAPMRNSPHTYARMSGSMPQHATSRLRDNAAQSPPAHRYPMPVPQPPPPHNDRVPPILHPPAVQQRLASIDSRATQGYSAIPSRREPSYSRTSHYDRHPTIPQRKYSPQQAYSYRSPAVPHPVQTHRIETHQHQPQYKHDAIDAMNAHYTTRQPERIPVPSQSHSHDVARLPPRTDFHGKNRNADSRSNYHYSTPSTSAVRFAPTAPTLPIAQNNPNIQTKSIYRPATAPKSSIDCSSSNHVQSSPSRSAVKPGYPNQQSRMTVSVTSIVNQMNQTKQKRESPLDLSVKTVKNTADSSTTQDDMIDSGTPDSKPVLQTRTPSNQHVVSVSGYSASHKVDFSPDFAQYRDERNPGHSYSAPPQSGHPIRYNGGYDSSQPIADPYLAESRHQVYPERSKFNSAVSRTECIPRIDLTKTIIDERHLDNRIRSERNYVIDERKRPAGAIANNIPDKMVRYETWSANSRIERMNQSAREQRDLMSQPVYSYASHKRLEAYQNDQKRSAVPNVYREQLPHVSQRFSNTTYTTETVHRDIHDYHGHYHNRIPSTNSRHVIQKIPSHNKELQPLLPHSELHNGVQPADKRVLSILRYNLETKQTGFVENTKIGRQVPELIVIDDVEDSVIEITDLTTDNDGDTTIKNNQKPVINQVRPTLSLDHNIQMPKAVDSIVRNTDYQRFESNSESKSKSPENDVASRIRTKAELKVMPPSNDNSIKSDSIAKSNSGTEVPSEKIKLMPKSQKQHLFNQIREDNLRLESVIKSENSAVATLVPEVKSEPMNIEEIEKDAEIPIKTENILETLEKEKIEVTPNQPAQELDIDWTNACDSFMEQLKSNCHKKKTQRKRIDTIENDNEVKVEKTTQLITPVAEITETIVDSTAIEALPIIEVTPVDKSMSVIEAMPVTQIKQEPVDENETPNAKEFPNSIVSQNIVSEIIVNKNKQGIKNEKTKSDKKNDKDNDKINKSKTKTKQRSIKNEGSSTSFLTIKKEKDETETTKTVIKEESESTDDDEPLIKSKILKEKEQTERMKYQLLKDLSEKSAYVKLECCDERVNIKNTRKSIDSSSKGKDEKQNKGKTKQISRCKGKSLSLDNSNDNQIDNSSTDSDDDALTVASRLRVRKNLKLDDNKIPSNSKSPVKTPLSKKGDNSNNANNCLSSLRKPGFGDGSDFHPGWEEELYRYKRSLRMPTRLIAIPRGRSGGPFVKGSGGSFTRGSTSLPDLDPVPLSPAPSSAPSAATDDMYRRPDKLTLDSDLESNSSSSAANRHYDSEASTSTVFSATKIKKKGSSIVDVLIQKCGKKEDTKKKSKEKEDKNPKVIPKSSNTTELLPTPNLGLVKNGNKGSVSAKKEQVVEDILYLNAFRKETVTAFKTAFIKNSDSLMGVTDEFAPVILKSRTRTESRVLKQRATIKEVFGDERPASAPPSCTNEVHDTKEDPPVVIKKEVESKPKFKPKKILKDKFKRRSSSIRDGLRSTKSLKRNDAKGRLLRLNKRNSLMKTFTTKRMKDCAANKIKKDKSPSPEDKSTSKDGGSAGTAEVNTKKRLKRLFGRRKFSSGFDYIRKKKKIIRRDETCNKIRRPAPKPNPESVHDIQKEIKGWFINKSIGETHLHRAARLGFTDCVAFCLEKMESDPSAKDNAGFTPLHVASSKGHVRIARLLLQYGANVSAAAQGGIRPLHEACENSHVEVIRLLLAYGADPLLGTYSGQTPEELADGQAALLLRLHIADVQGQAIEPWKFSSPAEIIDREEMGCDPLSSPPPGSPPPPPDSTIEIQCTEAPLPPFYSLRTVSGQPADGLWCLLQDVTNALQIKSKESLLKQIHCGSGSPKELLREIRTQEFLERAQCHQLLGAGEKVNVRASKVALIRVTDKLRQLLKIETVLVS